MVVPGQDKATRVVTDWQGNVYVTGVTHGSSASPDITTIKYTPSGDTAWARRISRVFGPLLALDKAGNAYVAGTTSNGDPQKNDFVVIKYSSAGDPVWVRYYNGPANLDDHATALAVDDSANVYLTGATAGPSPPGLMFLAYDYLTIKYSATGDTVWTRRWDGPDSLGDEPSALAVDDSGNVYVTGGSFDYLYSFPDNLPRSCATIKYNSAGDLLWVSRFKRPRLNAFEEPLALAVGESGNVYVGIMSHTHFDGYDYSFDYLTLKYDSQGSLLWTKVYNGPSDNYDYLVGLALDSRENVYVTGTSTPWDYSSAFMATVKYNSSGDSLWMQSFNVPGSQTDYAEALAVDPEGNLHVAGVSPTLAGSWNYTLLKYSALGDISWLHHYGAPANGAGGGDAISASLALDGEGNVLVTGTAYLPLAGGSAYATVKYNSAGDSLWVRTYNEPRLLNAENRALAFDIDASSNAYVTGTASYVTNTTEASTVKFSSQGDTLWMKSPVGPFGNQNLSSLFEVDRSGNVYMAVSSPGLSGWGNDFLTTKFTAAGDSAWARRYNGSSNGGDDPHSLAVDESGNVYVTGPSDKGNYCSACATIKYDAAGRSLWEKTYTKAAKSYEQGKSLAVDHSGNVYVAGDTFGGYTPPDTAFDFLTIKYSAVGDTLWVRNYDGPAHSHDGAGLIAVDAAGNVYVAGSANTRSWTKGDYGTIKYNSTGNLLWARTYNGQASGVDVPTALAVDLAGNVFITGYSQNADSSFDCVTIKYSPLGDTVWVKHSPQNGTSPAFVIADADGNAYVTLSCGDADSSNVTTKYSPIGAEEWVARYSHLSDVVGIRLDRQGNVFIAGTGLTAEGGALYAAVKYAQGPTSIESSTAPVPATFALEQNYPNPFNPTTRIVYTIGGVKGKGLGARNVELRVYDLLGREVATLVNEPKAPGNYEVSFDAAKLASGVYFYRLRSGSQVQSKTMVLIR